MLVIQYKNKEKEILKLKEGIENTTVSKMVTLKDEKGKARFSLLADDLLFFESSDNYVTIYFLREGDVKRELLRNTLKNMEQDLERYPFRRCHRSYMVIRHKRKKRPCD